MANQQHIPARSMQMYRSSDQQRCYLLHQHPDLGCRGISRLLLLPTFPPHRWRSPNTDHRPLRLLRLREPLRHGQHGQHRLDKGGARQHCQARVHVSRSTASWTPYQKFGVTPAEYSELGASSKKWRHFEPQLLSYGSR